MGDAGSLFLGYVLAATAIKLRFPEGVEIVTWHAESTDFSDRDAILERTQLIWTAGQNGHATRAGEMRGRQRHLSCSRVHLDRRQQR